MSFTLEGIPRGTTVDMTFERGAQSETYVNSKWGIRPNWHMSFTTENCGNNIVPGAELASGQPIMLRRQIVTSQSGTDRCYFSNLNGFESIANDYWNGGTAYVYIVTDGVPSRLAAAEITDTAVNLAALYSGANQMVTATTYEARIENYYRPSVGYWFRVAAINGSGQIGTKSAWVQYTAPASIGSSTASNPTLTSITHSGTSALAAPTGVAVAAKGGDTATAVVTWNSVGGASGYVVDISWQDPTTNTTPEYIDIDTTGLTIPAGAVVILEKLMLQQTDKWASRVWGDQNSWRLTQFVSGSPGDAAAGTGFQWVAYGTKPDGIDAEYFLRVAKTGAATLIEPAFHSGSGQTGEYYEVLEPGRTYKVRVALKANTPVTLTSTIGNVTGGSTTFNVTTSWQWFEHTFSRATTLSGSTAQTWKLETPSAATVDIGNWTISDTGLDVWDVQRHEKSLVPAGMFLRDHTQIKPGAKMSAMRQLFNRTGQAARGNTLWTLFKRCAENGTYPWIQIEWNEPDESWADFLAYVCAPVSSGHPMALLRDAQGRTTPWIDAFPQMVLEIGNEAWNTLGPFWETINFRFTDQGTTAQLTAGATYAAHCNRIIAGMKTSPYWRAFRAKTVFYAGGWGSTPSFENDFLAAAGPEITGVGTADYNGGWADGTNLDGESGASFRQVTRFRNATSTFSTRTAGVNTAGANFMVYEAGPDYPLPGTSSTADFLSQEVVMKSRAAGTGTLGAFSIRASSGVNVDNYFRLQRDAVWSSHASPAYGGGTFMSWGLLKLLWDAVGPSTARKIALVAPPLDGSVELLQAFEFKSAADPSNRVIVAVNRDTDVSLLDPSDPLYNVTPSGLHACSIPTGIASCSGLKYYANVGNYRQHNRFPAGFRRNGSTGALDVADSLCVAFTYNWTTGSALADADPIVINATYGAVSGGLPAGNCVLLHLTGCVDA
jgi:hypothetical protein